MAMRHATPRQSPLMRCLRGVPPFLWVTLSLLALAACRQEPPLPSLGPAPDFALTDQDGAAFGSADLGRRVTLANFVYTSCTDTCPLLSATMGQVQEQLKADGLLGNKVMLLSFSLDPDTYDNPNFGGSVVQMTGTLIEVAYDGGRRCWGALAYNTTANAQVAILTQSSP